ncbi:MAG: glycosyltransferase [Deltaproteobacteria bacterium]|nr:glycosyltransferase [Deltaproteobacteria bacterium]
MVGRGGGAAVTVSAVIPCHNVARYVGDAIRSCAADVDEIIVVDDGSTDELAGALVGFENVTLISQPQRGVSAARNAGAERATSEFLLFLDADDLVGPGQLAAMAPGDGDDVVATGHVNTSLLGEVHDTHELGPLRPDAFHALLPFNLWPPHALLLRRELFARLGGFRVSMRHHEDWELWLRLAASGARFRVVPGVHAIHRNRAGSASTNSAAMLSSALFVLAAAEAQHGCVECRRRAKAGRRAHRRHWLGLLGGALTTDIRELVQLVRADPGALREVARRLWR